MASTVIYSSGYPGITKPLEQQVSIGSDGVVKASAAFLVSTPAQERSYQLSSSIDKNIFTMLQEQDLQGLFVESRNLEKVNGLKYLRLSCIGVVNPPIVTTSVSVSARSFSKSIETSQNSTLAFSFDYLSETTTASVVVVEGKEISLSPKSPAVTAIWNRDGTGRIYGNSVWGQDKGEELGEIIVDSYGGTAPAVACYPRIITTTTEEVSMRIKKITKTLEFVFE